jgi:hypothetical protein
MTAGPEIQGSFRTGLPSSMYWFVPLIATYGGIAASSLDNGPVWRDRIVINHRSTFNILGVLSRPTVCEIASGVLDVQSCYCSRNGNPVGMHVLGTGR